MQLFSADAMAPDKNEKTSLKSCSQSTQSFLFQYCLGCQNGSKTEIPYHQKPLNAGLGI